MSGQPLAEARGAQAQEPFGTRETAAQTFKVGDRLPLALDREQLADVIGVSLTRLDVLRKARSHPAIKELLPRVGHPRFSGAVAQAWIDQQATEDRPRFFGSAWKRA